MKDENAMQLDARITDILTKRSLTYMISNRIMRSHQTKASLLPTNSPLRSTSGYGLLSTSTSKILNPKSLPPHPNSSRVVGVVTLSSHQVKSLLPLIQPFIVTNESLSTTFQLLVLLGLCPSAISSPTTTPQFQFLELGTHLNLSVGNSLPDLIP